MKRISYIFFGAFLSVLFSVNAFAQSFEGEITMEIISTKMDKPMLLVTSTKGKKSMTDMNMPQGGEMKIYVDQESRKMTTVMESMKMGMEMDIEKMQEMAKKMTKEASSGKVVATGEKKTINGHSCELYRLTVDTSKMTNIWMTDDLPKSIVNSLHGIYKNSSSSMGATGSASLAKQLEKYFEEGMVPIQVETFKDGVSEMKMTFVKYEQKHLDDSLFTIGSDIKIQKM